MSEIVYRICTLLEAVLIAFPSEPISVCCICS